MDKLKKTDSISIHKDPRTQQKITRQSHTMEGPAEEFINEYDSEPVLPPQNRRTKSTSPGQTKVRTR